MPAAFPYGICLNPVAKNHKAVNVITVTYGFTSNVTELMYKHITY